LVNTGQARQIEDGARGCKNFPLNSISGKSPTHILGEFLVLLEKNSIILCTNSVEWVTERQHNLA